MTQTPTRFWNLKALGSSEAELTLYGDIADTAWWSDEVSPKMLMNDLAALGDVSRIMVRINSYGGSVIAGHAMHSILKQHKAEVTVRIDGIAASAASIVAMAGDRIIMPSNAMMMIHNPWAFAIGDAEEMRQQADVLDKVRDSIVAAYRDRTGHSEEKLRELMDAETWMTAAEAVELGFADEVEEAVRVAASIGGGALNINGTSFDLARMRSIPAALFVGEEVKNVDKEKHVIENQADEDVVADDGQATEGTSAAEGGETNTEESGAGAAEETLTEAETATGEEDPVQNAILAERRRIADIQALARPGAEAVIAAAIEDGSSPADTALKILGSAEVRNMDLLGARRRDAAAINGIDPAVGEGTADSKSAGFLAAFSATAKGLIQSRGKSAPKE